MATTLGTDPRADPRMVDALRPFRLDGRVVPPPVSAASPRADQLAFCARLEAQMELLFEALASGLPPVPGVTTETVAIGGVTAYVHRPRDQSGPLPCVVHLHGGAMAMTTAADPLYRRLRDELAATGLVVVGVEFRNAAGRLGPHPFPAGLDDCADAVAWCLAHRDELGASHVVVAGESGGGNLALAVALEGVQGLAGVYAWCPYVSGTYADPPSDLPSLTEFDGYFMNRGAFAVMAEVYDPGGAHADRPACWPLAASVPELRNLPPHVISVNELDPLRDEGLAYLRHLQSAGVDAAGRVVAGTCHVGDLLLAAALPDVHAASLQDLSRFARAVGPLHAQPPAAASSGERNVGSRVQSN